LFGDLPYTPAPLVLAQNDRQEITMDQRFKPSRPLGRLFSHALDAIDIARSRWGNASVLSRVAGASDENKRLDAGLFEGVEKPSKVILWGASNYFRDYLRFLDEAKIKVAFAVDPCGVGMPREDVRTKSLARFRAELAQHSKIPVVLLENRVGSYVSNSWTAGNQILVNELRAQNPVVDPMFLCDHLRLDYRGRVVAGGFPGSGNGVLQAIMERLMGLAPRLWGGKEHLMGFLSGHHLQRLTDQLTSTLQDAGVAVNFTYPAPLYWNKLTLQIGTGEEEHAVFADVPGRPHLQSDIHRTHQVIDQHSVDYYHRSGFEFIVAIRHPLDILVSAAKKIAGSPEPVLRDREWFRDLAAALLRYCQALEDNRQRLNLMRYEDLLARPVELIHRVAEILQVPCSQEQAVQMWGNVGFKLLHFNPKHLWKPGEGKWRKYFDAENLDIVRDLGFADILAAQGYERDLDHGQLRAGESRAEAPQSLKLTAINDHYFSVLYDMPRHFEHPEVVEFQSERLACRAMATHSSIQRGIEMLDQDSVSNGLVNSPAKLVA
jgi:hypothetical protein